MRKHTHACMCMDKDKHTNTHTRFDGNFFVVKLMHERKKCDRFLPSPIQNIQPFVVQQPQKRLIFLANAARGIKCQAQINPILFGPQQWALTNINKSYDGDLIIVCTNFATHVFQQICNCITNHQPYYLHPTLFLEATLTFTINNE